MQRKTQSTQLCYEQIQHIIPYWITQHMHNWVLFYLRIAQILLDTCHYVVLDRNTVAYFADLSRR